MEAEAAAAEPEAPAVGAVAAAEPEEALPVEAAAAAEPEAPAVEAVAAALPEAPPVEAAAAAEPAAPTVEAVAPAEPDTPAAEPVAAMESAPPAAEPMGAAESAAPTVEAAAAAEPDARALEPAATSVTGEAHTPVVAAAAVPAPLGGTAPASPAREERRSAYLRYARLGLMGVAAMAAGAVALVLALVVAYRWVDPPVSTLMLGQRLAGTPIERRWVPLERISPHLVKAVVLSEDGGFCGHRGVDWTALEEAMESARGGSTITMQVVKNLFLWPSRSYLRKAIEIALAYVVELVWPKRRILEIYLNIAEWGDGVFGAEAAARLHFGKPAARLSAAEAALLAVALPNPVERDASSPSAGMSRLATRLLLRMAASRARLGCVRRAPQGAREAHLLPAAD
jgi:monofunctional biosynthetic peptidoglycan transglycosylase